MAQNHVEITAENNVEQLNKASCGVGYCNFPFMQKFASKKTYVIVYGLTGSFYLALSTYFVGTISTLEKRFQIPSFYIGLINSSCDVGVIFTTLTASYLGKSSHKTRWVACGTALVGLSCFVRLIPHWLYGPGENALLLTKEFSSQYFMNGSLQSAGEKMYMCGDKHVDAEDCEKSQSGYIAAFIFLIAHMMQGVGSSVYYTLGIAYLDDNARKTKVPMLLAISQCLRMIGPTFGYIFASYAVGNFIEPNVTPLISNEDPRWVGAWWLGWGHMGAICLVLSLCMAMFPKTLPRTAQRNLKTDAAELQNFVVQQEKPKLSIDDFKKTVVRLLKNKVLVCNSISSVCFTFGFLGQWIFLPKYMETQFHKSASNVSFISGAFGLLFTAAGILVSAAVISKFQPSARKLAGWNIFTEVLDCISFVAILFVGCGNRSFQGINMPTSQEFVNNCNSDCHCPDNTPFSPICQAQQSFFSPCHAGCSTVNSTFGSKYFESCTCAQGSEPAVDGLCPIDCGQAFAIFVTIHCIQRFFGATGRAGNTLIHFRCVSPEDKPVSVGLLEFCLCAFAFIPAPLVYGYLIDRACLIWGENCGVQGNCWVYDVDKLRFYVNLPILGCILLGTLWDIAVWYYVGQLPMYDEEDDKAKYTSSKSSK